MRRTATVCAASVTTTAREAALDRRLVALLIGAGARPLREPGGFAQE